jgi:hypothetical protein
VIFLRVNGGWMLGQILMREALSWRAQTKEALFEIRGVCTTDNLITKITPSSFINHNPASLHSTTSTFSLTTIIHYKKNTIVVV